MSRAPLAALAVLSALATHGLNAEPALPADPPPAAPTLRVADPLTETRCKLAADELADARRTVVELLTNGPPLAFDPQPWYSEGIAHFDNWLPAPDRPTRDQPEGARYRWHFLAGRVAKVEFLSDGQARLDYSVRYDRGRPVLCVNHTGAGIGYLSLAGYDARGLLARVLYLSKELDPVRLDLFENSDGYGTTQHWSFAPDGRFVSRVRYEDGQVLYLDRGGRERQVNSGDRLWWIRRLRRFGLAEIYPLPEPPAAAAEPPLRDGYDPGRVELRLTDLSVDPVAVEEQCTGRLTVRNAGGDYPDPVHVVGPSYLLCIRDAEGRLVFRAGGGWSGGMAAGQQHQFRFDTHSNTLPEAGGRVFLFPRPGNYTLTCSLRPGAGGRETDSRSVRFSVGLTRAEFRILD